MTGLFQPPRGSARETTRAEMNEALKRLVVPELRAMGFKGSMPHLRRRRGGEWDLLTFQFSQWGGQFVVEAARCRDAGVNTVVGHIAAEKATAQDLPYRCRVGSTADYDHWFKYEKDDPDAVAERLLAELRKPSLWEIADQLPKDGLR